MAEGSVTYQIRIDNTTGIGSTFVDYSSELRLDGTPLADAAITTTNVGNTFSFDINGLTTGTVNLVFLPDEMGGTLVTTHDDAVKNRRLIFIEIEKVPFSGESASPSVDAPQWVFSGLVMNRIGVPMPHGDEKAHTAPLSVQTAQRDTGSGLADF